MEFSNRTALITGAGSGIGAGLALAFAVRGANVVIADRNHEAGAAASDELKRMGHSATAIGCDVSSSESCRQVVEQTLKTFGSLDILVNNAAFAIYKRLLDTTDEEWDALTGTILDGTFYMCRTALPVMREHANCRVINIASVAGMKGLSMRGAYGAAKGGVVALTRALAVEVGRRGITVNAVAPGPIETPMVKGHTQQTRDR